MKYRLADLFAGVGGIRLGFEQTKQVECVFSSEIDIHAAKVYEENFGSSPLNDITKTEAKDIPDFDILTGGFPCQAFSVGGKRKGFSDTRGTLFFDIERILKEKRPSAFLLENVRGLTFHDKGKTFKVILSCLARLGYKVRYKILNSCHFGVPQKRNRIYIIGTLDHTIDFKIKIPYKTKTVEEILESKVHPKYCIKRKFYSERLKYLKQRKELGGFTHFIVDKTGFASTIITSSGGGCANYVEDHSVKEHKEYLKYKEEINEKFLRKFTPREFARLQGFPDNFRLGKNDNQSWKQFGNSVTVPVIYTIAKTLIKKLEEKRLENKTNQH